MKSFCCAILSLLLSINAWSQVSTTPFTCALDTFTPITGTTLDVPMADDNFYQHIPIGFNFDFAGSTHSEMIVSCNGYIQLDTFPTMLFTNILCSNSNNRIAAFGADLMHRNANASLQYATLGAAPNRVCVIQWLHYSYFAGTSGDVNVQIKLYEGSNCIRFVYGSNFYSTNPLQTQIGLRGTSNLDYLVLGDTSCNWASAYPFSSITTQFPVSSSCGMPEGFAFHFGSCASGSVILGSLTGNVFNDLNGDGIRDTSDRPIPHHIVSLSPGNSYVASDAHGDYAFFFFDSTSTYSLSTGGITYWNSTTSNPIAVQPLTQSSSGLDFGFAMIPGIHEMEVHCPNWNAKPGQPEPMPIWYRNNGTSTESDTITFVMDSLYSFISANPSPLSVNGSTITWVYPAIDPGQSGYIQLYLLPDSSAVLGDTLYSTVTIGPRNDTVPSNNTLFLNQLLSNSWDPNEKLVSPSGNIAAGTELTYTVHFQNTGNAPAANVVVVDPLDASTLDLKSLVIIGSSHPMNFQMSGSGIGTFTFYNIQLPDSGSDFAGSNGYFTFRVRTLAGLPQQTVVNNTAYIYFDTNPAVVTNTATVTVGLESPTTVHVLKPAVMAVAPNPGSNRVRFDFSPNENEKGVLSIYSATGQLLLADKPVISGQPIDLSSLPSGIYTAMIHFGDQVRSVKWIRE